MCSLQVDGIDARGASSTEHAGTSDRIGGSVHSSYAHRFGRRTMHHLFCATCAIHAIGRCRAGDQEKIVINLGCLEGVDVEALELKRFDGESY
jgi:hypothetical protein